MFEYARPPPSRPLPLRKTAPSVTSPITLYDDDKFTVPLAAVTLRAMAAVWVKLPDLPVMVMVDDPAAAALVASNVRFALAGVAPALKDPTTPVGNLERVNVTVLEKPFSGERVKVLVPLPPC